MIYTTESESDDADKKIDDERVTRSSNTMRYALDQFTSVTNKQKVNSIKEDEKNSLRKILQNYQGRKLKDRELRILQGVFQKDVA